MQALIIPWILVILILATIVCLIWKKWKIVFLLFGLLLAFNWWGKCIPFRLYNVSSVARSVKIISFNIDGATGDSIYKAQAVRSMLKQYSPDIVFLVEFNEWAPYTIDSLLREDYKYTTYPDNMFFHYFYGNYPFINSRRLMSKNGDLIGVYACSTIIQGDTVDLYGCHWASNNYNNSLERNGIEEIENHEDVINYLKNTHYASKKRTIEAETIIHEISKSSHRAILLGDMNDICGSSAIRVLENAGIKDAWWEKGIGYGATIHYPIPYRIDHIMHTDNIKLNSIQVLNSKAISDHDALYAEFDFD